MHQLAQKLTTIGTPASEAEETVVPSRPVSSNGGIGSPMSGDGISDGSRPRPVNRIQARGTARMGMSSQRAVRIGQASLAATVATVG